MQKYDNFNLKYKSVEYYLLKMTSQFIDNPLSSQ